MPKTLDPELLEELSAAAQDAGCELLHADFHGGLLKVYVDRSDGSGVSIADCERVSRHLSALLDVVDFGTGRYTLEVSSPGLDRQLYRPQDYERFCGRLVRVTYSQGETGGKRTVVGRLEAYRPAAGGEISVASAGGERLDIPLTSVQVARLEVEI